MARASVLIAALAVTAFALTANAEILVYTDGFASGWSNQQWDTYERTNNVHTGTKSLETAGGNFRFGTSGLTLGSDTTIEFYVNGLNAASWGVTVFTASGAQLGYDNRNTTTIYKVDGVDTPAAGGNSWGVMSDANSASWQKITLDLTQPTFYGWPYTANPVLDGTTTINEVRISTSGGGTAYVDDVRFFAGSEPPPPPPPHNPGDFTLDGMVTDADYTVWSDNYNMPIPAGLGDANDDGIYTDADYTAWADNYGFGVTPGNVVPEPATLSLLGLGLLALRRTRK